MTCRARKKLPSEIDVFCRDSHAFAASRAKNAEADIFEIGHAFHIDPGLRHGDDDIGLTEAERRQELELAIGIRNSLAHEIFARHAEMRRAGGEFGDDFRGGKESDLDALHRRDFAAIIARATPLHQNQTGPREEGRRVFLQSPFGGHCNDERCRKRPRRRAIRHRHSASP